MTPLTKALSMTQWMEALYSLDIGLKLHHEDRKFTALLPYQNHDTGLKMKAEIILDSLASYCLSQWC